MTRKTIREELAPAYNAFLRANPTNSDNPRTEERFNHLLEDAVAAGVSDIHLDPGAEQYRVRFRLDGALHDVASLELEAAGRLIRFLETRAEIEVPSPFEPHGGRAPFHVSGNEWELRFSTVPAVFGEKATLRLLGKHQTAIGIDHLGMSGDTTESLKNWLEESSGMLLVAGPTGSGKTTTLYSLIHQLKDRDRAIFTIENPIEYPIDGITQIEVNEHLEFTFAQGLKTILRLDPDFLLLGEIRDGKSAVTALDAAGTGRALVSSIHSRDAIGAVTTLRNYGVGNNEIASSLDLVIAQRLVRRLCKHCRQQGEVTLSEKQWLERHKLPVPARSWEAIGCKKCANTGYAGRIGIFELWKLDLHTRELIAAGTGEIELRANLSKTANPRALIDDGLEKAAAGETTISELRPAGINL